MCDYSIIAEKTRKAAVGDKLVTQRFVSSIGFADVSDSKTAVCVMPGTEIAFDEDAIEQSFVSKLLGRKRYTKTAIFRQVHKDVAMTHHDQLEWEDGTKTLLTSLTEGKTARVLQLPVTEEKRAAVREPGREHDEIYEGV